MRTTGDGAWLRAASLGLVLAVGAVLALTVDLPGVGAVRGLVDDGGGPAWVVLTLAVALALLTPVPRTAVSMLVGLVAGFGPGLAIALTGGLLGGLGAFGLSRWLGRPAVSRLAGRGLATVDRAMADRGFWALLVGRLLPVVPFVVLSYAAGLTAVRWRWYALATAIGLVPSTVVQVGLGASAVDLAGTSTVVSVVAGAALLVAAGVLAWRRRPAVGTSVASEATPA